MGLLDEAIREHLELKRRRGADPHEVEREQHEALDPIERESVPSDGDGEAPEAGVTAGDPPEDSPGELADAPHPPPVEPVPASGAPESGETAELDMRSVLGDESPSGDSPAHGDPATPGVAGGVRPARAAAAPLADEPPAGADDSLEWEMPGDEGEEALDDVEREEDVLEETPDFLRDTPEQDRLWFEQRPPRDFDFDK